MEMKWVVTGGAGFIGHHLVNTLIERGDEVVAIDNLANGDFPERRNAKATWEFIDITDPTKELVIENLCKGAAYIVHLAALPRVQFSIDNPVDTARVNVVGTVTMLAAAHKAKAKKFVLASSSSVYGDSEKLPLHESYPPEPMSPYALHKLQSEEYCQLFARAPFLLPTVCLRFFNVYGSGMDPNGPYALVVAKFLEQKRQRAELTITGDGEQTRDFTHVRDVVEGIIRAAEAEDVSMGDVINLGSGKQTSVNRIAELIDPQGEYNYIDARLEPRNTLASIAKAKMQLGWEPKVTIEDGIAELLRSNHP
jgi:UDP-glucose 4-epimerase